MLHLAFVLVSAPTFQDARPSAARPDEEGPRPFLYYDYVEDGVLRGGTVPIDPANPLHADDGVQRLVPTSPVTTLVDNGPSANRIDLVFVGDGYTAAELAQYAADVDAIWPSFLGESPLDEYASYFNVHRVDVTSLESGVDDDPVQGISRQTALDMTFWCSGTQRLLCVNVSKANAQAASAPGNDCVLALANSTTYGGAGYDSLGTLSGRNGSALEIGLHEFGHSFARLADEYDYGGPSTYTGPEPAERNVTIHTEAELVALGLRWHGWLDLPHVGTYQGAMYSRFGIYRPTFDSKMRSLGRPFQEVNSERFVRHVYRFVRPIDDATPAGKHPLDASFFVDPMDPVGHGLSVQWSLDGVPIPGATATTFDAATLGLGYGPRTLSVTVIDGTPLVRDPGIRAQHLTETRSWTLTDGHDLRPFGGPVGMAPPRLALETASTRPGTLRLRIDAEPGAVPLVLLSAAAVPGAERGPRIDLAAGLVARALGARLGADGSGFVTVSVPEDAALLERALFAQAALVVRDGSGARRIAWSNALELPLER